MFNREKTKAKLHRLENQSNRFHNGIRVVMSEKIYNDLENKDDFSFQYELLEIGKPTIVTDNVEQALDFLEGKSL